MDATNNLFNGKYDKAAPFVPKACMNTCGALPTDISPPKPPYVAPTLPAYTAPPPYQAPPVAGPALVDPPVQPPAFKKQCDDTCTAMYPPSPCDALVPTGPYIAACKADVTLTGLYTFSEPLRQAYSDKCSALAALLVFKFHLLTLFRLLTTKLQILMQVLRFKRHVD
jgi:hypothetical protein